MTILDSAGVNLLGEGGVGGGGAEGCPSPPNLDKGGGVPKRRDGFTGG